MILKPTAEIEQFLGEMQPLILLGMHRSGTSLTVRLLDDVGVHMGRRLSRDAEAIFFQKLNRLIYKAAGVPWGYIDPLVAAMQSQPFLQQQLERMRHGVFAPRHWFSRDPRVVDFFGRPVWRALQRGRPVAWGWKDPRTTLTFPIWLQIFPHARVVHLLRNGIDVAISTHRRTQRQQRKLQNRLLRFDYCPITLDFAYCFHLWEQHVSFVLDHRHLIPAGRYMEVRYEELLAAPAAHLEKILAFIGHPVSAEAVADACRRVDRSRLDNTDYARPYERDIPSLAASRLMEELGYHYG